MSVLPQRDGPDIGGAQERAMSEVVGGYDAVRTVEWQNGDGSWTRLSTRGGWPIFETDESASTANAPSVRGFVAKVPGGRAVLFDPYTLDVLKTPYTPAVNSYEVEPFATTWNVPSGDVTYWHDVVLFDGTKIKVNGKSMSVLDIIPDHSFAAIPHLIYVHSVGDEYGGTELNATQKRVFAVGRYSVTSWGGGGVTETLTPTEPRTESRALTIGQRIDGDTAYLGELYHGIDGWDSATEWYFRSAEIQMLLTAAYLVKTSVGANVAMTPPALASTGMSYGSMTTDIVLPATEVAMYGIGENNAANTPYVRCASAGYYGVVWPWSGTVEKNLLGDVLGTYDRLTYTGAEAASEAQSGVTLTYTSSNTKWFDSRQDTTRIKDQAVPLGDTDDAYSDLFLTANATDLWVGQDGTTPEPDPALSEARGTATKIVSGPAGISGSYCLRDYEVQTIVASVTAGAHTLVALTATREQSTGAKAEFAGNFTYYNTYLATPYAWIGASLGIGVSSSCGILPYVDPVDIIPIADYYRNSGSHCYDQDADAAAEINAKYASINAAVKAQILYDSENSEGFFSRTPAVAYYTASINPSVSLDNNSLTWATKDFILYDPTNEVYITVEGSFTGVDNEATLTVLLKVQTRHHTTMQTLGTFNYTYTEMLVEREIGTSGKYAVPSPQIRAIFAPLYCEQGSFKGAHYVTQAEEGNGATAFHGFNFVLNLLMYSDFDICNSENDGQAVYFVPCNLLEMLYAFVFSTEYGVAEDGTRYPVTYTSRFNEMRDTLFATPVRVAVRNGVATNWTDTLGGDFAAVGTVTLHRT
jgi:hypothetical protein